MISSKMKNAAAVLSWLSVLLLPLTASAQAPQADLSLPEAVRLALRDGTQARLARLSEEKARIDEREGLQYMFPQADARLSRSTESINLETFGFTVPGEPPVVGPFNVVDAQVTAATQIFNLAAIRRYQSLRKGTEASAHERKQADDAVIAAVTRLYVLVQRADAQVASRRSEIELFRRLAALARDELQAGTGTRLDVAQADLQLSRSSQALLVAENDRQNALIALLSSIGANQGDSVTLVDPLPVPPVPPSLEEALALAREKRPELKGLESRREAARLGLQAARARELPSLSLDFAGDYSGNKADDLRWSRRLTGLVTMPVFRPDLRANAARARIALEEVDIQQTDAERSVERQVRQSTMSLQNAEARVGVAKGAADVAEQALTIAREKKEAGFGSSVEVDRAEDSFRQAREDLIAARADAATAWYQFQYAVGTIGESFEVSR